MSIHFPERATRHSATYAHHLAEAARAGANTFVGPSAALAAVLRNVECLAPYPHATVLIEGESGTGKSYLARYLHNRSPRANEVFHQVVLSTLDDTLAASDLFGHLGGSFTDARQSRPGHFVTANRGTLFLDEIGKASMGMQGKLLHAIEHREIWPVGADRSIRLDLRIVAATNIPLATLVTAGRFHADLAARLDQFSVRMPALRERREDIPALVRQFVSSRASTCGHAAGIPRVDAELMAALVRADWPLNLRQLDGVVQRLLMEAAMSGDTTLSLDHCVSTLAYLRDTVRASVPPTPEQVREAIRSTRSKAEAARLLGISRSTLYRILEDEPACDELSAIAAIKTTNRED